MDGLNAANPDGQFWMKLHGVPDPSPTGSVPQHHPGNCACLPQPCHMNNLQINQFLCNLFKKKRTAATHVLVSMVSDDRRLKKQYAFPTRYIPYRTLKDQYIRDFGKVIKLVSCLFIFHKVATLLSAVLY